MTSIAETAADLGIRVDDGVPYLQLTPEEGARVRELSDALLAEAPGQSLEQRLEALAVRAHELPVRLRSVLTHFRLTGRPYGGLVVAGLPVDQDTLGPTPLSYTEEPRGHETESAAAALLLAGSLLGAPVSYLSQQRGRLVLDVFPVTGHEDSQLGSSSTANLEWHNEDAFHPLRADWIMLFCLRNPDRVPTTFAPVQDLELDEETRRVLGEERFVIFPDESHTEGFNRDTTGMDEDAWVGRAFAQIAEMNSSPRLTSVLSGPVDAPFIRMDPAFMKRDLGDPVAERALETVIAAIDARLRDVVLAPGELLIIDNKRAVHGRRPFRARHDGTDRWLRRINVAADLRVSEDRRYGPHGRALA
ncbi:guanitoxin biosynthesis L-enduracididine beta-hydroxylase GntD [Kitasatospora brasiliensis]|uniref:guanitoxin biosynthesis L-enduracididine beta-hydroxylase GntD n=1 Tax=Kitasatospora brasiliensis TaxID=3058040 RepID=UPI00292EC7EB|nr:guanitoxin biosynthesis L-enduracididine beta-hydroxylase GntD [Kitasatospora sp. K002]